MAGSSAAINKGSSSKRQDKKVGVLPPPDGYPVCTCAHCLQTTMQYERALLKTDTQQYVKWARFRKNHATGERDIREGAMCKGCCDTLRYEFSGIEASTMTQLRKDSAQLDERFIEARDNSVGLGH